jgi:hypothetical protein
MSVNKKEKAGSVHYSMVLHFIRLHGSERVQVQCHYSLQENLYCHEVESKQFTETSDHYILFLRINVSCVNKCNLL